MEMSTRPLTDPGVLGDLADAARAEGFRMVDRLIVEWATGANRFDRPGEALFAAYVDHQLVGVGGLTRQIDEVGRVRRLYILPSARRAGVGRALMKTIVEAAKSHFKTLVLRTDNPDAAKFYESLGFLPEPPDATGSITHRLPL
jgi:GNAT superfamily N-acetyltransferase